MPYDLPLRPSIAFYSFDSTLFGVTYAFRLAWNEVDQAWYMDVALQDGTPLATAIKLVLGAVIGPRLAKRVDGFPDGFFFVKDTSGKGQEAGFDDLGSRVLVRFFHESEMSLWLGLGVPIP